MVAVAANQAGSGPSSAIAANAPIEIGDKPVQQESANVLVVEPWPGS